MLGMARLAHIELRRSIGSLPVLARNLDRIEGFEGASE